jgi:hypothetical protein
MAMSEHGEATLFVLGKVKQTAGLEQHAIELVFNNSGRLWCWLDAGLLRDRDHRCERSVSLCAETCGDDDGESRVSR